MKNDELLIRLTRREAILCGLFSAAGLLIGDNLSVFAQTSPMPPSIKPAKAKSVIQIWMWGGPCHIDTFDPKPNAGNDYTGPFTNPIKTNADGIIVNEQLTELAKQADKYSLIRSMTHGNNGHETASYMVQTGYKAGDAIVHPGVGAIVSYLKGYNAGYKGLIPPYIVLTQLLGRFSEAGFLGSRAAPFATGGDPNQGRFVVEGVIAEGISDQRQRDRRNLLHELNTFKNFINDNPQIALLDQNENQAYELILGDGRKVFDLSQEKDDLRARYGKTSFGQSCLLARRLVERGVPFIAINYGGWDTHKQHFPTMRRKLPEFDKGLASLLQDLSDKGMLDSTIVWCCGEFGRTPKVQWEEPWNGGRGHWGQVFSALVAGGGFKGGQVIGASDDKGEDVKDRPVYPCDVIRSIYELMGIDPAEKLQHPNGDTIPIVPASWNGNVSNSRLNEIM